MQNHLKLFLLLLLLFTSNVLAKELKVVYEIALVGMAMDYSEYNDNGDLFDTEKSAFSEIIGSDFDYHYLFSYSDAGYSEVNFGVLYVSGYSDYTGSLLNSNNPFGSVTSKTLNDVIDVSLSYKYNNELNSLIAFNYGFGLGYRYWQRQLSRTQIEGYEWFSLRPSLGVDLNIFDDTYLNVNTEYQYAIKPKMSATTVASDFDLGSADILKLDIGLSYVVSENMDIFVNAIYEKQTITKSNTIIVGNLAYYEPDSTAYNKYVKIGIAFKY